MSEEPIELTPELLDDFYAECEEQLGNARQQLVALDHGTASSAAPALESLYRSVHSFKGNAAIVGLPSAEKLTHAAEGVLRRLTRGEADPDPQTLDIIGQVVDRLEAIVAAFRRHAALPEIDDLLPLLDRGATTGESEGTSAEAGAPPSAPTPPRDGERWRASFRPSAGLDRRGVNINTTRERLAAAGSIESAIPTVEPGGSVRFDFVVRTAQPPDAAAWAEDGVAWEPMAETATTEPRAPAAEAPAAAQIVRVHLDRLDELMRIAGELVIHRSRLQDRIAQAAGDTSSLQEVNLGLMRSLRDLRAAIMRVRLVPIVEIFSRLPFVVRDLTRGTDKRVRLVIDGQNTEIDKHLVERLKEPLLHLVRNAVSHGVEPADERVAGGKPAEATLRLIAEAKGDGVEIRVRDDGRGIDAAVVSARARAVGLPVPDPLDERALARLLCTPGFTTRNEADRAAGRGVGMSVVETTLRELGGSLLLATTPGEFTEFTLRLPLTLAIADTFVITAGEHRCAVPQAAVTEIVQVPAREIRTLNEAEAGPYRGGVLPLIRLRRLFGLPPSAPRDFPVLVVNTEHGAAGLLVDQVLGHREVVVRPLRDPLLRVPGVSGATELGDGNPVLILDPLTLGDAAALARRNPRRAGVAPAQLAS